MDREKGVLSQACKACGTDRLMTEQRDGAVAVAPCSKCNPETEKAALAPPPPPAPVRIQTRETGTSVDDSDSDE